MKYVSTENDLSEVCVLRLGWAVDLIKVILVVMPILLIVMGVVQFYQDRMLPASVVRHSVPYAAYLFVPYLVFIVWFVWSPWRRGSILIDKEKLFVPRFFRIQEFERGRTRVDVNTLSAEFHVCKVSNAFQSAVFYVNGSSASLLRLWSKSPMNESCKEHDI